MINGITSSDGGLIRQARFSDVPAICEIYNYYIKNTCITFEDEPVNRAEMDLRIKAVTKNFPWYIYEEDGIITAYAYLHYFHTRSAYKFTAEDSIYVKNGNQKKGIGKKLLRQLVLDAENLGIHTIMAVLGLPNEASERLHKSFGFTKAADIPELGYKFGKWIGVGYWTRHFA